MAMVVICKGTYDMEATAFGCCVLGPYSAS